MTSLKERKRLATRATILEVAQTLFEQQGFEKTSVDEIAARALISKFTFYNFFESKEALLSQMHIDAFENLNGQIPEELPAGLTIRQIFLDQVSAMAAWYEEHVEFTKILLENGRLVLPEDGDHHCLTPLSALIAQGQRVGEFSTSLKAEDVARYIFVLAHGEKKKWVDSKCSYSLKDKFLQAAEFVLLALRV